MKFGKQLKLQSVPEWQEYYMSYKRLKRVIKKLVVQQKERDERALRELAEGGKLTPEQLAQLKQEQLDKQAAGGKGAKSPIVQSFSPMLSSQKGTPEQGAGAGAGGSSAGQRPTRLGLGATRAGTTSPLMYPSPNMHAWAGGAAASPGSSASSKGSPATGGGVLMGGDAHAEFFSVLESDVEKVNRFFAAKYEELRERFKQIEAQSARSGASMTRSASQVARGGFASDKKGGDSDDEATEETDLITPRAKSAGGKFSASVAAVAAWMTSSKKKSEERAAREKEKLSSSSSSANNAAAKTDYGSLEAQSHKRGQSESDLLSRSRSGDDGSFSSRRNSSTDPAQQPTHTISVSAQKQLDERLQSLLDLYRPALQLQIYSMINYEGLRKIVKKFDKNIGEEHSESWVTRLDSEAFRDTEALNTLVANIEDLYTKLNLRKPNQDLYSSQGILRGVKREVDNPTEEDPNQHQMSLVYVLLALAVASAILLLPILPHEPRAKSCAALLGMITVLWVSEAVPFFVGALAIPFTVVILGILADATGTPLTADKASKAAFGFMFNDTIMLILGGFSISAAFSKCNFELRLASVIQRAFGDKPRLFLLAFMLLGCFLSCWISNIAAPVLLTSLLLPIVRDFGAQSDYARALLLGLAFSCNIGGMMSPISSPQNAISLGYLEATLPEQAISFGRWLSVSFPFCLVLVVVCWVYLVLVFCKHQEDVQEIPMIVFEKQPIDRTQVTVMLVTLATIVLWCTLSETAGIFGEMGTIAVIPIVVFFGSGILNKADLQGFSWQLILLIGGGNVLGAAVNSSQLLHIISQALEPYLAGHSPYVTTITVLLAVWMVTTFVSHTVAALILTPIIVDIARGTGQVQVVAMLSTLMMSGAMSLPMSSFPNANSLLVDDDFGRPFLHPMDFVKHGTAISVACCTTLCTVGYALAYFFLNHADAGAMPVKGGTHHGLM